MSLIQRLPPGQVLARIPFDDCLLAPPRRAMPADLARWALSLPVPRSLADMGLARPLREAVAPLWDAVMARFRQGLRIEAGAHAKVVVHCDTVRYEFTPQGRIHGRLPVEGGGYQTTPLEVGTPFPSWHWVRLLGQREPEAVAPLVHSIHIRQLAGLIPRDVPEGEVQSQAIDWLASIMEGLARRCIDGLRMREQLRCALAIDPALLLAARRARPRHLVDQDVGTTGWNRCIEHRNTLLELQSNAPGLVPLYGQLMWDGNVSPHRRNVDALRDAMVKGLPPADWKRLSRESARPVWEMYRAHHIRSMNSLKGFVACWARLHRGLPAGMRMPLALWEPLARTWVGPLSDYAMPPVRWPGTPAATRQAIERYLAARACGSGQRFLDEEWAPVVRWAGDYSNSSRPAVGHWSTLKRLAAQDERRLSAKLAGMRWDSPLPRFESGQLLALAIQTGEDLAEEAIAMRHCADRFAGECARGEIHIYGLKDRLTGERLATLALATGEKTVSLDQVARSLNREPTTLQLDFARKLVAKINRLMRPEAIRDPKSKAMGEAQSDIGVRG